MLPRGELREEASAYSITRVLRNRISRPLLLWRPTLFLFSSENRTELPDHGYENGGPMCRLGLCFGRDRCRTRQTLASSRNLRLCAYFVGILFFNFLLDLPRLRAFPPRKHVGRCELFLYRRIWDRFSCHSCASLERLKRPLRMASLQAD